VDEEQRSVSWDRPRMAVQWDASLGLVLAPAGAWPQSWSGFAAGHASVGTNTSGDETNESARRRVVPGVRCSTRVTATLLGVIYPSAANAMAKATLSP
jgi:hypothetical protein